MSEESALRLSWSRLEGTECLRVSVLSNVAAEKLLDRLAVLPAEALGEGIALEQLQPVAGDVVLDGSDVCFVPRFPFVDGLSYAVVVSGSTEHRARVHQLRRASTIGVPVAEVLEIYPTATEVPLNQLKLYIHFSRPMSEGRAARGVRISRAVDGALLEGVLAETEPELWSPDRQRLTLLLDPGRIKRGLAPNAQVGYPLVEGAPVVVSIEQAFLDAEGMPLRAGFERHYEVGEAIRKRVDPGDWTVFAPATAVDPLIVHFDRPLDRALLEHSFSVCDPEGAEVWGSVWVGRGEQSWQFTPRLRWKPGRHSLVVQSRLEDLAGNSLARVFDRDLSREEETPRERSSASIEFSCAELQHR